MTLSRRDLIVGVGAGAPAVAAVPSLAHESDDLEDEIAVAMEEHAIEKYKRLVQ